jgi:hypothetical protein
MYEGAHDCAQDIQYVLSSIRTPLCFASPPAEHEISGERQKEDPDHYRATLERENAQYKPEFHRRCHDHAPANIPTPMYLPVVSSIAPDIGGPASAPTEIIEKYMPVRRPTSALSPSAIIGAPMRVTIAPDAAP